VSATGAPGSGRDRHAPGTMVPDTRRDVAGSSV
jgi:hypothetical protein